MPYEEMKHDSEVLRAMFDFLELQFVPEYLKPLTEIIQ